MSVREWAKNSGLDWATLAQAAAQVPGWQAKNEAQMHEQQREQQRVRLRERCIVYSCFVQPRCECILHSLQSAVSEETSAETA